MTTLTDDQQQSRSGSDTTPAPSVPLVLPPKHTSSSANQTSLPYHIPGNLLRFRNNSVATTETDDSERQNRSTQKARISRRRRRAQRSLESAESSSATPISPTFPSVSSSSVVSENASTIPERPAFSQYTPPRLLGPNPMLKQPRVRKHIYAGAVRSSAPIGAIYTSKSQLQHEIGVKLNIHRALLGLRNNNVYSPNARGTDHCSLSILAVNVL